VAGGGGGWGRGGGGRGGSTIGDAGDASPPTSYAVDFFIA
jgi:hypothetical protein